MSARWPWARMVLRALREAGVEIDASLGVTGLNVWDRLPKTGRSAGPGRRHRPIRVTADEAVDRLDGCSGADSEDRPAQRDYCGEAAAIYAAKETPATTPSCWRKPAPGSARRLAIWRPRPSGRSAMPGTVWISTYTKNLQRQLEQETARAYPDPATRRRKVVVRKGRENYLCLLNLQDWNARAAPTKGRAALFAALVARWARVTRDGDMVGGDFPAWLMPLFAPCGLRPRPDHVSPCRSA